MRTINLYQCWPGGVAADKNKILFYRRERKEGQLLVLLSALSRIAVEAVAGATLPMFIPLYTAESLFPPAKLEFQGNFPALPITKLYYPGKELFFRRDLHRSLEPSWSAE